MTNGNNPYTKQVDDVMTNFDHTIDKRIAKLLKTENVYAKYPGWNFNGTVWYDKEAKTYRCDVWCYHKLEKTVSGSLKSIMKQICEEYGDD